MTGNKERIMTAYLVVTVFALALIYLGVRFSRAYFRLRGPRVVTCPQDHGQAAVDINVRKAAAGATVGTPRFALTNCSHWPERQACGQECLKEIEAAPFDCLVRTHLERWYERKTCAICRRPIGAIDWYERSPALLAADRKTLAWSDVDASRLDAILATHAPVCFDCHIAETFRRTHPELVLDNPYAPPPAGRM